MVKTARMITLVLITVRYGRDSNSREKVRI